MAARPVRYQITFLILVSGVTTYGVLQSLIIPALPELQRTLHSNPADATWIMTAYLLSSAVFTPIVGRVGDMFGKKRMTVATLGILVVGSALAALATSLPVMLVARVIQGVSGGVLALAFGIIRDEFPAAKVPNAVGTMAGLLAVASGVGVVLAGPIIDVFGIPWLFWFPMIIAAVACVAVHFFVTESTSRSAGSINWLAAALMSGFLVAVLLAVSKAPTWGWTASSVLGLLALSAVLLPLWIWVEVHSSSPLIDMRMMRIRAVWSTNLAAFMFGMGQYALFSFAPGFFESPSSDGYGFSASVTEAGLMILPITGLMVVSSMLTGPLGARVGSKAVLMSGSVIAVVSFLFLAFAHDRTAEIYPEMAGIGIGFGFAFSAMATLIVAAVPPEQTGVASGMNANIRTIGGCVGAATMATLVADATPIGGFPRESGYTNGFLMMAGAMVFTLFAAVLIPRVRRDPVRHTEPHVELRHPELAILPAGTLVGDGPE